MAALYGGTDGNHLTPNGLALQYYAYGYALAPDAAAYESYWSADHEYHQSPTILPGYTEGDIIIEAMEPMVEEGEFVNKNALTPYLNFADVSTGEKRRTVAMVLTSPGSGYFVDIFRSDLDNNNYLSHHVGSTMELADAQGYSLSTTPVERMENCYHKGYDWLTDIGKSVCNEPFTVTWTMPEEITAHLWMTAADGRKGLYIERRRRTIICTTETALLYGRLRLDTRK